MKTFEAMDVISSHYVSGAVSYFDSQPKNEWEQAFESWHLKLMAEPDWAFKEKINELFVDRIIGLLENYKKATAGIPVVETPAEAFWSKEITDKNRSSRTRTCLYCSRKKNLKPKSDAQKRAFFVCIDPAPGTCGVGFAS